MHAAGARRLALFVLLSLALRGPLLWVRCWSADEAVYLLGGRALLAGQRLYTDVADNKPPLVYASYAAADRLAGGLFGAHLLGALLVLPLTALALSACWRHDARGAAAGALYLLASSADVGRDSLAVNAEPLMLLPAAWALVPFFRDDGPPSAIRGFGAGVLIGIATLFKQQALLWLAALAVAAIGGPVALLSLTALVIGAAIPLLATWLAFAVTGGASDLVAWTITRNLRYVGNPVTLGEALPLGALRLGVWLLAMAPLAWGAWTSRATLGTRQRRLLAALLVATIPAALAGWRFYPHYFLQWLPPLALAAAPAFDALAAREPRRAALSLATAWLAFVVVGYTVANGVLYGATTIPEEARPEYDAVARALKDDPCRPGATLFVWGYAPLFYVSTGLPPASRFVLPQASLSGFVPGNRASFDAPERTAALIDERDWDTLFADLDARHATYVLDTAPSGIHHWDRYPVDRFPRLRAYLHEGYDAVATVDGVVVWRRRGCAP